MSKMRVKILTLKLKIQKTKIMAFSPITAWQIDAETMETVTGFTFLCSQITEDGDFSCERKRRLLLGKKAMTNQDSMLKSRDITLPTKVRPVKDTVFPALMYGCASWTGRKAAGRNIDAFGLWSWRRLLRVPWTAAKSKPPILKETNPEYSSEELMLPLKLPILRPPATKNWLIRTDPDGGQDSRRGEEGDDRKGRD